MSQSQPSPALTDVRSESQVPTNVVSAVAFCCRYPSNEFDTLSSLDVEIGEGRFVLILGPSGCGKTTFALCLRGLIPEEIDAELRGSLLVVGRDPRTEDVLALAENVFLVQQDPDAQIVSLMAEDDVAFGLENLGVEQKEMHRRVETALSLVGLAALRKKETYNMSGGQKQRLGIASGLAMESDLLVLDAPTSNLDPKGTQEIMDTLGALRQKRGQSVVLIESKVDELIPLVDEVIVMGRGGNVLVQAAPRRAMVQVSQGEHAHLGLRLPQVSEIFAYLRKSGISSNTFPLSVDEAEAELRRMLEAGEVRIDRTAALDPGSRRSSEDSAIRIEGLSFSYPDGTQALRGPINLDIAAGDFVGMIGNNGGGKSTLCQIMGGLLRPTEGAVYLKGADTRGLSMREIVSRIAYSFQQPARQMVANTVFDEIAYGLRLRKIEEAEVQARVQSAMEEFDLENVRTSHPLALSMGEMRRLSVASMLVLNPEAFILDEPMQGLDRESQELLMGILVEANRRGISMIIVSHDMRTVAEYAETVLLVDQGVVSFHGDTRVFFGKVLGEGDHAAIVPPPVTQLALRLTDLGLSPFTLTTSEFCDQIRPGGN